MLYHWHGFFLLVNLKKINVKINANAMQVLREGLLLSLAFVVYF